MNRTQKREANRNHRKQMTAPIRVKHEKRWGRSYNKNENATLPTSPYYAQYRASLQEWHDQIKLLEGVKKYTDFMKSFPQLVESGLSIQECTDQGEEMWETLTKEQQEIAKAFLAQQESVSAPITLEDVNVATPSEHT